MFKKKTIGKKLRRYIGATLVLVLLLSACHSTTNSPKEPTAMTQEEPRKDSIKKEPEIVDTGQVWFNVNITKNDTPYIHYEGTWPLLLMSNNSVTLQLAASKKLMSITNMLTIYSHGLPTGKVPVVMSNREENTVSMVMSQVIKGNYDIPILPGEGFLNITKNTGTVLSGNFQAKAVDADKNNFLLTGTFLNVGVNNSDYIK